MRGSCKGGCSRPRSQRSSRRFPRRRLDPRPRPSAVWGRSTARRRLCRGPLLERALEPATTSAQRILDALQPVALSGASTSPTGGISVVTSRSRSADGPGSTCAPSSRSMPAGAVLARVRAHLRPTLLSMAVGVLGFAAILLAATSLWTPRWSIPSAAVIAAGVSALATRDVPNGFHAGLAARRGPARARTRGCAGVGAGRPTVRFAPDLALWRYVGRSALASLFVVGLLLGSSLLMRDAVVTTVEHFEQVQAPGRRTGGPGTHVAPRRSDGRTQR